MSDQTPPTNQPAEIPVFFENPEFQSSPPMEGRAPQASRRPEGFWVKWLNLLRPRPGGQKPARGAGGSNTSGSGSGGGPGGSQGGGSAGQLPNGRRGGRPGVRRISWLTRWFWALKQAFLRLLFLPGMWGLVRFFLIFLITMALIDISSLWFGSPQSRKVGLLARENLAFWVAPITALIVAFLSGVNYLRDVYEITPLRPAFQYLFSSFVGIFYPFLKVEEGKAVRVNDKINTLDLIGGPGNVFIVPGNAVLFERIDGPANVRGAGIHFISRMEHIKQITSLEDQQATIQVKGTTKDGIEVVVNNVSYCYRLFYHQPHRFNERAQGPEARRLGDYKSRTPELPYPFTVDAMRKMTYNRNTNPNGPQPWDMAVKILVDGVISDFINQNRYDTLVAPAPGEDPRARIYEQFDGPGFKQRMYRIGAELLRVDIGNFDLSEGMEQPIRHQRAQAWGAYWKGSADVTRAEGEAYRQVNLEQAHAQGEVDILVAIIDALREASPTEDLAHNLRRVIMDHTSRFYSQLADCSDRSEPPITMWRRLPGGKNDNNR